MNVLRFEFFRIRMHVYPLYYAHYIYYSRKAIAYTNYCLGNWLFWHIQAFPCIFWEFRKFNVAHYTQLSSIMSFVQKIIIKHNKKKSLITTAYGTQMSSSRPHLRISLHKHHLTDCQAQDETLIIAGWLYSQVNEQTKFSKGGQLIVCDKKRLSISSTDLIHVCIEISFLCMTS